MFSYLKKPALFLALTIIVSSVSNLVNKYAMSAFGNNAYQYTFLKNFLAAVCLCLLLLLPTIGSKLLKLSVKDWSKLLVIGLVGGAVPFLLYFKGMSLTSALSASLLHKTLFIWVGLLAWPVLKEKFSYWQYGGLLALLVGVLMFDGISNLKFGYAEILIVLAVWLWAVENIISKKVLAKIDSAIIAWGRMFFGVIYIFIFLLATKNLPTISTLTEANWFWLLGVGLLLFLYNYFWYGALKELSATLATSVLALAYPLTVTWNAIFVSHSFPTAKILPSVIICLACILLSQVGKPKHYEQRTV